MSTARQVFRHFFDTVPVVRRFKARAGKWTEDARLNDGSNRHIGSGTVSGCRAVINRPDFLGGFLADYFYWRRGYQRAEIEEHPVGAEDPPAFLQGIDHALRWKSSKRFGE